MGWNIAHASRIPILEPRASNVWVLFVHDVFIVREVLVQGLDHVYSAGSGADGHDSKTTRCPKGLLQDGIVIVLGAGGADCWISRHVGLSEVWCRAPSGVCGRGIQRENMSWFISRYNMLEDMY